jgi:hypothetical protein
LVEDGGVLDEIEGVRWLLLGDANEDTVGERLGQFVKRFFQWLNDDLLLCFRDDGNRHTLVH